MIFSVTVPHSFYLMTLSMIVFYIGYATCQAVIFNISMNIFPEIKGIASSTVSSVRYLIIAIVIGLASCVYNGQAISVAILVLYALVLGLIFTAYSLLLKDPV